MSKEAEKYLTIADALTEDGILKDHYITETEAGKEVAQHINLYDDGDEGISGLQYYLYLYGVVVMGICRN
jgi:hypothetical protein